MSGEERTRFKEKIDRAFLGTKINYPTYNLEDDLSRFIINEIKLKGKSNYFSNKIYRFFSDSSQKYGIPLKSDIKGFCDFHNIHLPSEIIRLVMGKDIEGVIDEDYDLLEQRLYDALFSYILSLKEEDVFKNILNISFSDSSFEFLTNISGYKLMDSYSGKLLKGKIQLATDRGYPDDLSKPQQDALVSVVRDENHFLNAIADGAGGSNMGENASRYTIEEVRNWFIGLSEEELSDVDLIIDLFKEKINEIGNEIKEKYKKSYTTLVLALTINDKTIIMNVGDSTAYSFVETDLVRLSVLDSWADEYDYEDVRWSVYSNIITAAIGDGFVLSPHVKIIENNGQRIILSSDGVTDLVSEETFTSYFNNYSSAEKIVDDALNNPEVTYAVDDSSGVEEIYSIKESDNISVIVIDLPKKHLKKF